MTTLSYPNNTLNFDSCEDLEAGIDTLTSINAPQGLNIYWDSQMNKVPALRKLSEALKSGKAPEHLTIHFGKMPKICDEGANLLAQVLDSEHAPSKLNFMFTGHCVSDIGFISMLQALRLGRGPQELTMYFSLHKFGPTAISALAELLKSGEISQKIDIGLAGGEINDDDFKLLTDALGSGRAPKGVSINLLANLISSTGVQHLYDALLSDNMPQDLTLNLCSNRIDDEGAKLLANGLSSGKAPMGLTIDLTHNRIGAEGIQALVQVFNEGRYPEGLIIKGFPEVETAAHEAKQHRHMMTIAHACLALGQPQKLFTGKEALNEDIISTIASYLHPKGVTIARNSQSFFSLRTNVNFSLPELNINIQKIAIILNIKEPVNKIKNVFKGYYQMSSLSLIERNTKARLFLSALQKIGSEINQDKVLVELNRFSQMDSDNEKALGIDEVISEDIEQQDIGCHIACTLS